MTRGGLDEAGVRPERPAAAASRYRADIDGLRAIAVLAVILTHAHVAGFSGGFVGVDIFFVISGYLIYRDLEIRLREGRLSLLGFYGRRMRRTLPALYLVGFATLAAATWVLLPGDLDETARSLVATVLLVPNIFFLTQSGYFDATAGTKPLLHTWSLGVEEQFYLLAPILPLALRPLTPNRRRLALALLFAAALAGCVALRHALPTAAFYLMPPRIFEFVIGAALVEGFVPPWHRPWFAEAVTLLALATLAVSIANFSDATAHPGVPTLAPCLATAAIIHAGTTRRTFVGALLGLRIPASVGLMSYSLYLWHWPILVLARAADLPASPALLAGQALLLFGLSVLSWRYVETPFRRPGSAWLRRAPVLVPAGAACLVGCSVLVLVSHGLPQRFPPEVASVASYSTYRDQKPFREGQCFMTSKNWFDEYDRATCLKSLPGAINVLLLGDSQAAHLWTGLRDTWPGVNVLQATASGCKPVIGTTGASRCTQMMRDMLERFIPHHHLDAVVISALWDPADVEPLKQTLARLKVAVDRIIVFGPMPHYDQPLSTLIAEGMIRGDLDEVSKHLLHGVAELDAQMRSEIGPRAIYVSSYEALCRGDQCRFLAAPGVPMQFDYNHLTPLGSDVLMAAIRTGHPSLFAGATP